jgi:hypothetical protein
MQLSRIPIALVLMFASAPVTWAEDAPATAAPSVHLADKILGEARRIRDSLKKTEYSHTTKIDEAAGSYAVDCSGFVCFLLKKFAPTHYKDISKGEHKRPLAENFYDHFAASPSTDKGRWRRVERLADARPGDWIAWRRAESEAGESTGHIVFVEAAPVREDDGQYRVVVLDSTSSPHADDTRPKGSNGIGTGTMWFTVDAAGKPVAYRWRSIKGTLRTEAIAIGRALDE